MIPLTNPDRRRPVTRWSRFRGPTVAGRASGGGLLVEPSTLVRGHDEPAAEMRSAGRSRGRWGRPESRPPLVPGDRLGEYRLLERLGHGGQGDVYKAIRGGAGYGLVALKVLRPSLARDPARMAQFHREAERGGRLAGPALLPVSDRGIENGYHFMVMPYIEGITMRGVIRARAARLAGQPVEDSHRLVELDESRYVHAMLGILAGAAECLARVHGQRVAHRDVKPANILLDDGRPEAVYLCDFGLGRDLEVATLQQMRDGAGTPMYMAPERLLRAPADEIRCDIYSLGVTIFEALTLCRPFRVPEHITLAALPAFLAVARPRRPGEVRPGFPDDLEAVILAAIDRDPARRPESAGWLATELRRIEARLSSPGTRALIDKGHPIVPRGPHAAILTWGAEGESTCASHPA